MTTETTKAPPADGRTGEILPEVIPAGAIEVLDDWQEVARLLTTPGMRVEVQADQDPDVIAAAIAAEILSADDPLANLPTISSKDPDTHGVPIEIRSAKVLASRLADTGKGVYIALRCRTQGSVECVLTSSSLGICAVVTALARDGKLPAVGQIKTSKTNQGFDVFRLEHASFKAGATPTKLTDRLLRDAGEETPL